MGYGKDVRDGLREPFRALRQALPGVMEGYTGLHNAAMAPGALDVKTKELIALAVAVAKQCDGCIAATAGGPPARAPPPRRWPRPWGWPSCSTGAPAPSTGPGPTRRSWRRWPRLRRLEPGPVGAETGRSWDSGTSPLTPTPTGWPAPWPRTGR